MPGPPACSLSVLTSAVASPLPCFRLQCNRGRPRSSWISLLPPLSAGLLSLRSDICCGLSAALLQASTQRRQTSQQPASIAPAASACLPTLTLCHLSPTLTLCHLLPTLTLCHLSLSAALLQASTRPRPTSQQPAFITAASSLTPRHLLPPPQLACQLTHCVRSAPVAPLLPFCRLQRNRGRPRSSRLRPRGRQIPHYAPEIASPALQLPRARSSPRCRRRLGHDRIEYGPRASG